jgi:hypothetical protein
MPLFEFLILLHDAKMSTTDSIEPLREDPKKVLNTLQTLKEKSSINGTHLNNLSKLKFNH